VSPYPTFDRLESLSESGVVSRESGEEVVVGMVNSVCTVCTVWMVTILLPPCKVYPWWYRFGPRVGPVTTTI